jgi:Flp pilus assembly protein TadD
VVLVIGGAALARWFAPEPGSYTLHKEAVASVLQELRAQDAQQLRAHVLEASLAPLPGDTLVLYPCPDAALARSLALSGKTDSARRVLHAAATRLPDRADVHLALGALSLNLQQYDDAVAAFSSALRLDPGNPALVHDLGIARLQLATQRLNTGDESGARRALDEVLSTGIAPESTRARFVIDSLGRQPD